MFEEISKTWLVNFTCRFKKATYSYTRVIHGRKEHGQTVAREDVLSCRFFPVLPWLELVVFESTQKLVWVWMAKSKCQASCHLSGIHTSWNKPPNKLYMVELSKEKKIRMDLLEVIYALKQPMCNHHYCNACLFYHREDLLAKRNGHSVYQSCLCNLSLPLCQNWL
jgi:hypothetical protein